MSMDRPPEAAFLVNGASATLVEHQAGAAILIVGIGKLGIRHHSTRENSTSADIERSVHTTRFQRRLGDISVSAAGPAIRSVWANTTSVRHVEKAPRPKMAHAIFACYGAPKSRPT